MAYKQYKHTKHVKNGEFNQIIFTDWKHINMFNIYYQATSLKAFFNSFLVLEFGSILHVNK